MNGSPVKCLLIRIINGISLTKSNQLSSYLICRCKAPFNQRTFNKQNFGRHRKYCIAPKMHFFLLLHQWVSKSVFNAMVAMLSTPVACLKVTFCCSNDHLTFKPRGRLKVCMHLITPLCINHDFELCNVT